ncbi:hypothetical protein [Sphingopyxis sp.]|uniref:hypothetical protein n=1 Tax=Sphingopyxis sp. TaxID=1908224 RepID=UPI003BAC4D65
MSWKKKLLSKISDGGDMEETTLPDHRSKVATETVAVDDPRYQQFFEARERHWRSIGTLDEAVIAYIISPEFLGKPAWPTTRQAYRVIRTAHSFIIASDGLTDLFVDTNSEKPGFGTEVYIEVPDLAHADFDQIKRHWAFSLIPDFAAYVAHAGGIETQVERLGLLSIEFPEPEGVPDTWLTERKSLGALINVTIPDRPMDVDLGSGAKALMIPLTILTATETKFVLENGANGRVELARRLTDAGVGIRSDLSRESLV